MNCAIVQPYGYPPTPYAYPRNNIPAHNTRIIYLRTSRDTIYLNIPSCLNHTTVWHIKLLLANLSDHRHYIPPLFYIYSLAYQTTVG